MKKTCMRVLTLALALVATLPAAAQLEFNIHNMANYQEEKYPGGFDFSISVLDFNKKDKHHEHHRGVDFFVGNGIGFGWINTMNTPPMMDTRMGKSLEVDLSDLVGLKYRIGKGHSLRTGLGVMFRNYRMVDDFRFTQNEQGHIAIEPYPEGANPKFSRIRTNYLTLNAKYQYKHRGWKFVVGPEFDFCPDRNNRNRTIKTRYSLDGDKYKDVTKDIHANNFNFNLYAGVGYKFLGVYARYSPSSVLNKNFGPDFNTMSVGIKLFGL